MYIFSKKWYNIIRWLPVLQKRLIMLIYVPRGLRINSHSMHSSLSFWESCSTNPRFAVGSASVPRVLLTQSGSGKKAFFFSKPLIIVHLPRLSSYQPHKGAKMQKSKLKWSKNSTATKNTLEKKIRWLPCWLRIGAKFQATFGISPYRKAIQWCNLGDQVLLAHKQVEDFPGHPWKSLRILWIRVYGIWELWIFKYEDWNSVICCPLFVFLFFYLQKTVGIFSSSSRMFQWWF